MTASRSHVNREVWTTLFAVISLVHSAFLSAVFDPVTDEKLSIRNAVLLCLALLSLSVFILSLYGVANHDLIVRSGMLRVAILVASLCFGGLCFALFGVNLPAYFAVMISWTVATIGIRFALERTK